MKQLLSLALALLPCLAWAQYPSNGNQKITLGEQTTADGLIYRGVASTDTVRKPSIDTMAYMVLDTTTNIIWHYKKATSNAWLRLNLLPSDTASMLTPYWRAGRFSGTLPVANGGTGSATKNFVALSTADTITAQKVFNTTIKSRITGDAVVYADNGGTNRIYAQYQNNGGSYYTGINGLDVSGNNPLATNSTSYAAVMVVGNRDMVIANNFEARITIKDGGETFMNGTTDRGTYNLQVNGTGVWGEGAYANGSDANIKENIVNLDSSLNIVNNLKPVVFNYINASVNNDTKHLGFIAQDVYQTLENKDYLGSIVRSDGDTLSIAYSNIIPLLTKAIQEQNALIKALEQRIINLENK